MSVPPTIRALQFGSAVALALMVAAAVVGRVSGGAPDFGNRLSALILVAGALVVVARAVYVSVDRAAWVLFAIGASSWAFADIYYDFHVRSLADPPYPSLADAGYLTFYPTVYVGLLLLARRRVTTLSPALCIDGLIATLAAASLGAAVLLEFILGQGVGGNTAEVATNLAYPIGDILLIAAVAAMIVISGGVVGRAWSLIALSLVLTTVADGVYLFKVANGTYVGGGLLDAMWPAAMLALAAAAWQREAVATRSETGGRPLLLVPMVCGLLSLGVLAFDRVRGVNDVAVICALGALLAILVRLQLTFRENSKLFARTREEAVTDALTGLPNRRQLMADLDRALAGSTADEPSLLLLFDLDGFKTYNDTFGHPAGDMLLVRLGAKLAAAPPVGGRAYRLGGDEFCLLTPVAASEAGAVIERASQALEEDGEGFSIRSSFGAVFLPTEASVAEEALRIVDGRLYAQKHQRHSERDRPQDVLLQVLQEREPLLAEHHEGVRRLAGAVGACMGLETNELEHLVRAADVHDIGKLGVPDEILRKHGPLTDEEWAFIRRHPLIGERILAASPALRSIAETVRSTHERWDGEGYPDRLAGEEIPLPARVIAVCDGFTAMTSDRPYRAAMTVTEALAELERGAGTQFDPLLVERVRAVVTADPALFTARDAAA
jgi:two-component system cell cycle response regulator